MAAGPATWARVREALRVAHHRARRRAGHRGPRRRRAAAADRGGRLRRLLLVARSRDERRAAVPSRRRPLPPNWRHLPIGYHGRCGHGGGQRDADPPARRPAPRARRRRAGLRPQHAPRRRARVGLRRRRAERARRAGGRRAPRSTTSSASLLVNDWSARDVQAWEYRPLGPFLAKSFATSVAAWVTPLEAILDRRVAAPAQEPAPLRLPARGARGRSTSTSRSSSTAPSLRARTRAICTGRRPSSSRT